MEPIVNAIIVLGLAYIAVDLIKHIINVRAARNIYTPLPGGTVTRERELGDREFHTGSSRIAMGGTLTSLEEKKK